MAADHFDKNGRDAIRRKLDETDVEEALALLSSAQEKENTTATLGLTEVV